MRFAFAVHKEEEELAENDVTDGEEREGGDERVEGRDSIPLGRVKEMGSLKRKH